MGVITWNGVPSTNVRVFVQHQPEYIIPEREYEYTHIEGRSGDLVYDKGSYSNVPRTYEIGIDASRNGDDYSTIMNKVAEWLHSGTGYQRLEDTYDADHYRLATYDDETTLSNIFDQAGEATISFNCRPERFLKSGETVVTINSSGGYVTNPTNQTAKPLLKVYGSSPGRLNIGLYPVNITILNDYIYLDCDSMDAYHLTSENYNNAVAPLNYRFPVFVPGRNYITWTGGITKVEVTPRWWTL